MSRIKYILIITFILLLTACTSRDDTVIEPPVKITANTEITNDIPADDNGAEDIAPKNAQKLPTAEEKSFLQYSEKIISDLQEYEAGEDTYITKENDLWDYSTEGGEIKGSFEGDACVAFEAVLFGEMGRSEYKYYDFRDYKYLTEVWTKYNVPFYVKEAEEGMDAFDPEKSVLTTTEYVSTSDGWFILDRENEKLARADEEALGAFVNSIGRINFFTDNDVVEEVLNTDELKERMEKLLGETAYDQMMLIMTEGVSNTMPYDNLTYSGELNDIGIYMSVELKITDDGYIYCLGYSYLDGGYTFYTNDNQYKDRLPDFMKIYGEGYELKFVFKDI